MEFYTGGELLKHIRKVLGVTQRELGMNKINHNIISRIEKNAEAISLVHAIRLSENINAFAQQKENSLHITATELLETVEVKFEKWCDKELEVIPLCQDEQEKIRRYYEIIEKSKLYQKANISNQVLQLLADEYYRQSRLTEAFNHYRECLLYYETKYDALKLIEINLCLGMCLYPTDLDEAFKYYHKAYRLLENVEVSPKSNYLNAKVIYYLSSYHARKENFICAQDYLDFVIYSEINDKDLYVRMLILQGNIHLKRNFYTEAVEILENSLQQDETLTAPYKHIIYNNLGICFNYLGDYEKSIESLNMAIKLQLERNLPEFTNSLIHTGKVYIKLEKHNISIRFIEAALGNAIKHKQFKYVIECYELLYSIYRKMKRKDDCYLITEKMTQAIVDFKLDNDFLNTYYLIKVDYLVQNDDLRSAKALLDNIIDRKEYV